MSQTGGPIKRFIEIASRMSAEPLFRLLMINLGIGLLVSGLLLGGLLAFNLHGLRDLIMADQSPATALILLLFGFAITFGSAAMGTAIMAIGQRNAPPSGGRPVTVQPVAAPATEAGGRRRP